MRLSVSSLKGIATYKLCCSIRLMSANCWMLSSRRARHLAWHAGRQPQSSSRRLRTFRCRSSVLIKLCDLSNPLPSSFIANGDIAMTPNTKGSYDYIIVGGGAAGSVVAGELSKTGVDVLLIESGGV